MKNNRYIIVILLPVAESKQIESIQKNYENKLWQITMPPHITLVRPGTAILNEDRAIERLNTINLPHSQVKILASNMDMFLNGPNANVAYLRVTLNNDLINLHKCIYKSASRFMEIANDYPEFIPHVTIANNIADEQTLDDIVGDVSTKNISLNFVCSGVHLFKKADQDKNWIWLAERKLS